MLRYIVSHLRERALSTDCQYISATIFDGVNNIKRKRAPILGARKKLTQKSCPDPKEFLRKMKNRVD